MGTFHRPDSVSRSLGAFLLRLRRAAGNPARQSVDQVAAQVKPGYVTDLAGVLSQSPATTHRALHGSQTENPSGDRGRHDQIARRPAVEDYSIDLATQLGFGPKSDRGVLILFAVDDHQYRSKSATGLSRFCPTARSAASVARPSRISGNNYDAAVLC